MEDKIEKLFRNKLRDELPKEENWNMPSDDLWDKASQGFAKDKKRRRPIWILFTLIGILSLGLGYSFVHIQTLNKKVTLLEEGQKTLLLPNTSEDAIDNVITKSANTTNTAIVSSAATPSSRGSENGFLSTHTGNNNESTKSPSNGYGVNDKNNKTSSNGAISREDLTNISGTTNNFRSSTDAIFPNSNNVKENILPIISSNNNNLLDVINLIPSADIELLYVNNLIPPNVLIKQNANKSRNPKYILSLFGGPSLTAAPVRGIQAGDFATMHGSDNFKKSYNFGGEIGFKLLPNLYAKTGLQYQLIKYWSQTKIETNYDKVTEFLNTSGEMQNRQSMSFASATGMIDSEVSIIHPTSIRVNQGDVINATMDLHQNLHYISIPLGIEYYQPLFKKLELSAGIGLSWNKLIKAQNIVRPEITHDGISMKAQSIENSQSMVSSSVNYYMSVGLNYDVTKHHSINLRGSFFENATSVFKKDDMYTKICGYNLQAGVSLKF